MHLALRRSAVLLAADDVFNAGHDKTVGSDNGSDAGRFGLLDTGSCAGGVVRHYLG